MINLLGDIPENPTIALSGGVDSMAVADFISRSRKIKCAFFHHGTFTSHDAFEFVAKYCAFRKWPLELGRIASPKEKVESPEEYWRNQRYLWLSSLGPNVITAHHLDDCVETYLWSMMHGTAKVIPYRRNNVIRPFLVTEKAELVSWAERNNVPHVEDKSNADVKYIRNYVRHNLMPHALHVNPGLRKVVAKKVKEFNERTNEELDMTV
jgi:tRNA(Ile)-lysidine synthetase-like protein